MLSRYRPLGRPPGLGPLVICYGLIGRQTMTDLTPERSLVRNLLAAGVDVFVLDWGQAEAGDAGNGFDHYADAQLGRALAAVRATSGAARPALLGICQGGVFAACHAALHGQGLSGLVLAVTPVDFHADAEDADPSHGLLNLWIRSLDEADLEAMIGDVGNLPGEMMGLVFNQLNPVRTIAKYAIELPDTARDPRALATFLAMEKWLADRPDLPGALARDWLIRLYRRNELAAGRFEMGGVPGRAGPYRRAGAERVRRRRPHHPAALQPGAGAPCRAAALSRVVATDRPCRRLRQRPISGAAGARNHGLDARSGRLTRWTAISTSRRPRGPLGPPAIHSRAWLLAASAASKCAS